MARNFEAIAINTSNEEGRLIGKGLLNVASQQQAEDMLRALSMVDGVRALPACRDFDVFGRCVWMEARPL